jgi:hypothetical protein
MIRIYYLLISIVLAAPAIIMLVDLLRFVGILETPDPGLVKRMRPF